VSPFYYYLGNDPLVNGLHWGHAALLAGLFLAAVALSVVFFERRDLRQTS
jgi:ABC-2 type transport system permease protein